MPRVLCSPLDRVTEPVPDYQRLHNAFTVMVPRQGECHGPEASSSGC